MNLNCLFKGHNFINEACTKCGEILPCKILPCKHEYKSLMEFDLKDNGMIIDKILIYECQKCKEIKREQVRGF